MLLRYYTDEQGNRVYTLKVIIGQQPLYLIGNFYHFRQLLMEIEQYVLISSSGFCLILFSIQLLYSDKRFISFRGFKLGSFSLETDMQPSKNAPCRELFELCSICFRVRSDPRLTTRATCLLYVAAEYIFQSIFALLCSLQTHCLILQIQILLGIFI